MITKHNLSELSLSNFEVLQLIDELSVQLDSDGFRKSLDTIERLTGVRDFLTSEAYQFHKSNVVRKNHYPANSRLFCEYVEHYN